MAVPLRPDAVNILVVDDQPAKLLTYEAILAELGEELITRQLGERGARALLKHEIAVVLVDVCMPDLDGYELAAMIRQHPRCQKTSIIFVSAVLMAELDRLRGYECGAVDYVPVPVVPEILRAKVERLRRAVSQDARARAAERRARAARRGAHRGARGHDGRRCRRRTGARTSSWRCWRTSCAIRWRRSAPRCSCCASRSCPRRTAPGRRDIIDGRSSTWCA